MWREIKRWYYRGKLRGLRAEIERSLLEEAVLGDSGDGVYAFTLNLWIAKCKANAVAIEQRLSNLN